MKNFFTVIFILMLVIMIGSVQAQSLIINEFLASNDSCYADPNGEYDDWIEIYNYGNTAVDVGGMYITDDLTNPTAWQIPATAPDSTTIPAGGFLVLWADKEPEQGVLHVNIKLSSGGEQIGLFASDGTTVIDSLTFGAQTTDISFGRLPDASAKWQTFDNPTPGYTNRAIPVIVNEFMASNNFFIADPFGEFDDWIEIFNAGTSPVDIGGMYITDDLTDPTAWQIPATDPDSTTIPAGGFLVLWADKQPEQGVLHVNIKLSSGGEQIGLFASDGVSAIDTLTFGSQISDTSYGRIQDGATHWGFFSTPTFGISNSGGELVGISSHPNPVANGYYLSQNYPNPFNPATTITYRLADRVPVTLTIYNTLGQKVRTLVNEVKAAGEYEARWNGANDFGEQVSSGIYIYTLNAGQFSSSGKMLLMK